MRTTCFATPKDAFMNVARGNYDAWPQSGRVRNIMEGERESALAVVIDYVLCSAVQFFHACCAFFLTHITAHIYTDFIHCIGMQTALLNILKRAHEQTISLHVHLGIHWSVPRKSGSLHVMR